jgi:hypothetical protein
LIFAGISLSQDYFRASAIILATVLKIYPAFLVLTLAKRPKLFLTIILIIVGYLIFSYNELHILQTGNTALTDPASIFASYGLDTNLRNIQQIITGLPATIFAILKYILILISLLLILLISQNNNLKPTENSTYKTDLFITGGIIFSSSYLITSNWDYRLIFLLLCIPYILCIQNRVLKHSVLICILLSSNATILMQFFGQSGIYLGLLSKYYVFLMVSACLVRELENYLSHTPFASSKSNITRIITGFQKKANS